MPSLYRRTILEFAPDSNPNHIEAWMRLKYGTLDHLSREEFQEEVQVAVECIAKWSDSDNETLARSYGLHERTT
jgi:pyrroloquinoline quinone (PQQ) biosynthesis protein C